MLCALCRDANAIVQCASYIVYHEKDSEKSHPKVCNEMEILSCSGFSLDTIFSLCSYFSWTLTNRQPIRISRRVPMQNACIIYLPDRLWVQAGLCLHAPTTDHIPYLVSLCAAVCVCVFAFPTQPIQPFSYDFIYILKSLSIPVVISFTLLFVLCAAHRAYTIHTYIEQRTMDALAVPVLPTVRRIARLHEKGALPSSYIVHANVNVCAVRCT